AGEADRCRVKLVRPPLLVVRSGRQGAADVDVPDVTESGDARQRGDHRVEAVDQLAHFRDARRNGVESLLAEAWLEPRAGKMTPPTEEAAAVRDGVVVPVHENRQRTIEAIRADLGHGAQNRDVGIVEADV